VWTWQKGEGNQSVERSIESGKQRTEVWQCSEVCGWSSESSDGLNLFSRLVSSWSSVSLFTRSLGWVCSLPQRCTLSFVITSQTVGMFRSRWINPFGKYHGGFTKTPSTVFWNRCNISVLQLLAVSHNYKVVQIWPGQTVTCLHTYSPGHIWTTLYIL
jgi:hypothetical protein